MDKIDKNSDAVHLPIQPELLLTGKRTIKRKFDSYTVNGINLFIKRLDNIITMSKHSSSSIYTKEDCERNAREEYLKVLTKGQQKILKFDTLISYQKHTSKEDNGIIKLVTSKNDIVNGWTCMICLPNSGQIRKDKVFDHILSEKHWKEVMARATREVDNSVQNKMKNYAELKDLPNMIQTGVAIVVAQKSLPFTAWTTILNTATKVITTLIGNEIIPMKDIQNARYHGLNKIATLAEKMNYLYEPAKKNSLALEAN